ncbi:MAG TPA: class I SAM-dependent methyltransferase [bacterium]|nr:class I SAM-dependent methyltransferase [bacterium]
MSPINSLVSDLELDKEMIDCLKNRGLEQKFLYLDNGAKFYYEAYGRPSEAPSVDLLVKSYCEVIINQFKKKQHIALISLGCGDASSEKIMLKKLKDEGFNFTYFGVDSSRQMLDLAVKNLAELKIDSQFLCADIVSEDFCGEISQLTDEFDCRGFLFLGGTISNFNQTNIIDSLYSVLKKNDFLFLDIRIRNSLDTTEDLQLFNFYSRYLKDKEIVQWLNRPLRDVGIDTNCGTLNLEMVKEKSIGAILFKFSFLFNKKFVIRLRNDIIHFLPEERVELLHIRAYYPEDLNNFFKEHNFKLAQSLTNKEIRDGFFVYQKID